MHQNVGGCESLSLPALLIAVPSGIPILKQIPSCFGTEASCILFWQWSNAQCNWQLEDSMDMEKVSRFCDWLRQWTMLKWSTTCSNFEAQKVCSELLFLQQNAWAKKIVSCLFCQEPWCNGGVQEVWCCTYERSLSLNDAWVWSKRLQVLLITRVAMLPM